MTKNGQEFLFSGPKFEQWRPALLQAGLFDAEQPLSAPGMPAYGQPSSQSQQLAYAGGYAPPQPQAPPKTGISLVGLAAHRRRHCHLRVRCLGDCARGARQRSRQRDAKQCGRLRWAGHCGSAAACNTRYALRARRIIAARLRSTSSSVVRPGGDADAHGGLPLPDGGPHQQVPSSWMAAMTRGCVPARRRRRAT